MSYEVTATRRRPQKFDDLVGQEFVAETLKNSIKSGKIAHAYLFSGPRGCGKTSTARILAKALNCANGPTDTPCGQCSNCLEITKGSSLDVIEIDGASNTSVENIRQIKDEVLFPPANCRYKIYIIDEVHMLSTSAFNALLKTIEEPPPYVIFIFATTELQKVPATIKSRCQQFNFRLVAIEKVKQCLAEAAAELNIQADDEALYWVARESTGSMRDAYTLFDQVVAFSDGHMTYEKIRDKLGLVGIDRLNTIFEACAQNQTETVINLLDDFLQAGISIEQLISNTADYLRSLLLIKNNIKRESLLGNSVERYSRVVLSAWNSVQIERALSIFLQLYRDIRYSLSPRYELELAFSRLCWISQYVSNVEVKKAIDAAQALLTGRAGGAVTSEVSELNPTGTSFGSPVTQNFADKLLDKPADQPVNQSVNQPVNQSVFSAMNDSSSAVSSASAGNIPPGLPRLSMLTDLEKSEAMEHSSDVNVQGDDSNPFYNGGSLPPKKSVIVEVSPNEVFTENPDNEDDGWSNTTDIPQDDYYIESDEERLKDIEASYEEMQKAENMATIAPAQNSETFKLNDGSTLTIGQLRGKVMAGLSVNNSFIATTLEKTGLWQVVGDTVSTTVQSGYELSLLEKNIAVLNKELSDICMKPMTFSIKMGEKIVQKQSTREIPNQVKIIVDMFKGTLIV